MGTRTDELWKRFDETFALLPDAIAEIEAEALSELDAEERAARVKRAKDRILKRRAMPWWSRWFPWRITLSRID